MSSTCRICLSEGNQVVSIFTDTGSGLICEKVMFCATVEVSIDDTLPSNICVTCMDRLDVSYNFRRQCEETDCWLRENLGFIDIKTSDILTTESGKCKKKSRGKSLGDVKRKSARITAKKQPENETELDDTHLDNVALGMDIKEEPVEDVKLENSLSQDGDDYKYEDNGFMDFVDNNDDENDSDYFGDKVAKKSHKHSKKKSKHGKKKKKRGRKPKIYYDENGEMTLTKPPVRYCCEHCGKYFTSGSYLKVHSKIHLGVKSFECETCGKKFSTRDYLRKHARTHSDIKLYKCQYCPKGFNDWGSRQKHERIHRKERPYVCDICGKKFTYSYTMTKHKLIHSGLKMFSCDICKRKFTMKYHLKSHQMRVHKDIFGPQTQTTVTNAKNDNSSLQNSIPAESSAQPDMNPSLTDSLIPVVTSSTDVTTNSINFVIDERKPMILSEDPYGNCLKTSGLEQ